MRVNNGNDKISCCATTAAFATGVMALAQCLAVPSIFTGTGMKTVAAQLIFGVALANAIGSSSQAMTGFRTKHKAIPFLSNAASVALVIVSGVMAYKDPENNATPLYFLLGSLAKMTIDSVWACSRPIETGYVERLMLC